MKKVYRKPEIMFESFSLCTNIAAGCEVITKLQGENSCGWKPDDRWTSGIIFTDSSTGCETTPSESGYDGLCYHAPSEDYNVFTS